MPQVLLKALLRALVIPWGSICVDMGEVFCVCSAAASLPTPASTLLDSLFSLSFGKESVITTQVSSFRDRSSPLVQVVFDIQVSEYKMIL